MKRNAADLPSSGGSEVIHGRPILSLKSHSIEALDAGEPASVMVSMENTGRLPAVNVYFGMECLLVDQLETFETYVLHALCEMPMRPGCSHMQSRECLDLHFPLRHLHRAHLAAIKRGERLLLILARLEYGSPEGNFHWSHVCLQYDGRAITLRSTVSDCEVASVNGVLVSAQASVSQHEF